VDVDGYFNNNIMNKKFLTETDRLESLKRRSELIKESFKSEFNKIKRIDEKTVYQGLDELSREPSLKDIDMPIKDKGVFSQVGNDNTADDTSDLNSYRDKVQQQNGSDYSNDKPVSPGYLDELSPETKQSAQDKMRDKGQNARADRLKLQNLEKFVGQEIYDGQFKITGFENIEGKAPHPDRSGGKDSKIVILMQDGEGNPGRATYFPDMDYYDMNHEMSRKSARLLSMIAKTINPKTKYSNGTGDFRITGY
jgi:hypothetical protein